jgi:hypothetical protein
MSVRVRDLLKLPTLSRSHIAAGEAGLDRIVSTGIGNRLFSDVGGPTRTLSAGKFG